MNGDLRPAHDPDVPEGSAIDLLATAKRAPRHAGAPPRRPRTRGSRLRSVGWSNVARWTRARAVRRARGHSPATGGPASRTSTCATRPKPTRPCRTPSSRCSRTSTLPRSLALRGVVDAHSHQWLPGSPEGAGAARSLVGRARSRARTGARASPRPAPRPREAPAARERAMALAAAIARLDGRQRTVFMLCHFDDWTTREVRHDRARTNRPSACTCFAPRASCAACSEASRDPAIASAPPRRAPV